MDWAFSLGYEIDLVYFDKYNSALHATDHLPTSSTGREEPSGGVTCMTAPAALLSFNVLVGMSALGG